MVMRGFYPMIPLSTPIENLSWVDGEKFTESYPLLEFVVAKGKQFTWGDFVRPSANIPLFSPRFKELLDQIGVNNIDYYDATITYEETGETRLYFAGNIIGMVSALDRDTSEYELFDDNGDIAESIDKLVLDEKALQDIKVCRLSEYGLLIIVDESIKVIAEKNNLEGMRFLRQEEYSGMFS
jgi:hypothetical protein